MARWFFLATFATLLLLACAKAASQPSATSSPVAALPTSPATTPASATPTDTAVPTGTTPPSLTITDSPLPAGTPPVLVTPSPSQGTTSTSTPDKTNQPTDHPATSATPSRAPTTAPTKAPTAPATTPPTAKPTKPPTAPPTPSKPPTQPPTPSPSPAPTPHWDISINSNRSFSPANFTINAGDKVIWYAAASGHSVTAADGEWGTGNSKVARGDTYSHTFNTAGDFAYICVFHSGMTGTIHVN